MSAWLSYAWNLQPSLMLMAIFMTAAAALIIIDSIRKTIDQYNWRVKKIKELEDRLNPKLRLDFDSSCHKDLPNGQKSYIAAFNDGELTIQGVEVKVESSKYKNTDDNEYVDTNFIARTNLSWCREPDGSPRKYAAISLSNGKELLDLVSAPFPIQVSGEEKKAFRLRVDPNHGPLLGLWWEPGIYKFTFQISGIDAGGPKFIDINVLWNGDRYKIERETGAGA